MEEKGDSEVLKYVQVVRRRIIKRDISKRKWTEGARGKKKRKEKDYFYAKKTSSRKKWNQK